MVIRFVQRYTMIRTIEWSSRVRAFLASLARSPIAWGEQ